MHVIPSVSTQWEVWPRLPIAEWGDTRDTLHMWTQIAGKIRLALCPRLNHWWQVALHPYARGLTTLLTPFGQRLFEIRFDLVGHELVIETANGQKYARPLSAVSVAELYRELMDVLHGFGIDPSISTLPSEVEHPTRFEEDTVHAAYDPVYARRFGAVLVQSDRVLQKYRSRFVGKSSPVHFFWGGFDLAVTRFSGRTAPEHPSVPNVPDFVVREAYSHEVMSVGFWPGAGAIDACFYAYAYPEPRGFRDAAVLPREAAYNATLGEFVLPYEAVRTANDPDEALLTFAESTYAAAADLGAWDRAALERRPFPDEPRAPVRPRTASRAPAP